MAAKKKSKKKIKRKPARNKYERTRASIRRRFLEDAATHFRPEVEEMRAAIEELSADDHFWETMERVAMHTTWRPSARRVSRRSS
ncbi:hypothetical protein LCGC14_1179330 [marine sediment metagenome]|uniref:Uncharacterized protein n=1 Tax=marine sediment metagenome TaxID=412755 RepID=A0A0F9LSH0_9ZZZZ